MHVLDDEHDAWATTTLELVEHCRKNPLAARAVCEGIQQHATHLATHVAQRSERLRRGERIAGAPQKPGGRPAPASELAHECGLADPGLARDECYAAAAGGGVIVPSRKHRKLLVSLEEQHRGTLPVLMRVRRPGAGLF